MVHVVGTAGHERSSRAQFARALTFFYGFTFETLHHFCIWSRQHLTSFTGGTLSTLDHFPHLACNLPHDHVHTHTHILGAVGCIDIIWWHSFKLQRGVQHVLHKTVTAVFFSGTISSRTIFCDDTQNVSQLLHKRNNSPCEITRNMYHSFLRTKGAISYLVSNFLYIYAGQLCCTFLFCTFSFVQKKKTHKNTKGSVWMAS